MCSSPLISIIITTYNRASLLEYCIQSVLTQRYTNVEIIVVDDGSTDETENVVRKYHNRIRYVRKEHSGIAATRNVGCQYATGMYIAFVDDDDLMHSRRLPELHSALRRHPKAVCAFCQGSEIDISGRDTGRKAFPNMRIWSEEILLENAYEEMLLGNITVTPWNCLFKRSIWDEIAGFDETFIHGCEDTDFFMRMCDVGPMVYVPEVLTYVRRNAGPSLTKEELGMAYSKVQLFEKHIQINCDRGRRGYMRLLQDREYHFMKEIMIRSRDLHGFQERHNVNLTRILARFGTKRVLYLFYLRYVKRFRNAHFAH